MGADGDATHLTIEPSPYLLEIGLPDFLGFIIGVADVVSYGSPFAADCADSCHNSSRRILSMIFVVEWPER